ncbi:UDP-N-acetylmuramoyl-tripeptide--D-alanyl-D-alanine ligase [Thermosulfidibacter takaii ABI70S6]|uniref:UDP-N-acetylmuramoyl-tripeptide--D-alanyl-D-alanine ligase n=1 Tax=Thermosulfidibacter takaii (strain DSM 17441 / JCM 13301 / NBRC 103674 / ABI70S6) TaxID=1298851 RepID=A0A0S3QU39_THET7|nr:UDP-N-acetylmuramoyl-tripeptide--D-alanyl-D-alanine ligase [Thermosulfidibacter takaii]BAT71848.1 UDP-N-acetylmuramoyl-tripeptide--D-alanyl-D-alanine ligase [Thermosulfidibacter takaii ABI70S6]
MTLGELFKGIGKLPDKIFNLPFKGVSIDSRKECQGKVFIALRGERFDGHDFVKDAVDNGASLCVVESPVDVPHIVVNSTFDVLWLLASRWLDYVSPKVVAVTGSCGKTTTKEMIALALSEQFRCFRNEGNQNNLIGVPLNICNMPENTEVAVLELGTNAFGEISKLASLCCPYVSIITSIGASHLSGLESLEGVFKEKISLVDYTKEGVIFPAGTEFSDRVLEICGRKRIECVLLGNKKTGFWFEELEAGYYRFYLDGKAIELKASFAGEHMGYNALVGLTVAMLLGADIEKGASNLSNFEPLPGRFRIERIRNVTLIDDTYNANPLSTKAALAYLRKLPTSRKIFLFGSMLELGEHSEGLHREIGEYAYKSGVDLMLTYGDEARWSLDEFLKLGGEGKHCKSHEEMIRNVFSVLSEGDVVLVKGSRGMRMEKVVEGIRTCFGS